MAIPEGLLVDVKNRLNITWSDEAEDKKVSGIIEDGMFYLNNKRGGEADFAETGIPRALLFEYCRYARDNALDVFENNFLSLIIAMKNERAVTENAEETVPSDE